MNTAMNSGCANSGLANCPIRMPRSANGTTPAQIARQASIQLIAGRSGWYSTIDTVTMTTMLSRASARAATSLDTRYPVPVSGVTRSWRFQPSERSVTMLNACDSAAIMPPYADTWMVVTTIHGRCVTASTWPRPPNVPPKASSMTSGTASVKIMARMFLSWRRDSRPR